MSTLYIVATPIGNLEDVSPRALNILKSVTLIAAEDTRHSQKLLNHFGIHNKLTAYHTHNEQESISRLIAHLKAGQSIALISDAGTPAISDPGYHLVKAALAEKNIKVVPVPGACAAISALSASGLPSDRFVFEGFLPASPIARKNRLHELKVETRTLIFYEAPHRLVETLKDLNEILGEDREATLARELTKIFETIYKADLKALYSFVMQDANQTRGECVLIIRGISQTQLEQQHLDKAEYLLKILLTGLPLKKAVKITAELCAVSKNILYDKALAIK